MQAEQEFKWQVTEHLEKVTGSLTPVLKQLIEYNYPQEVEILAFEIFVDGFSSGFPVRVFFMDKFNSEHFIYINGKAEYPSPVDPDLLSIEYVYPYELEEKYIDDEGNTEWDPWNAASEVLIEWFAKCWQVAGGEQFKLKATIALHDSGSAFNLIGNKWQANQ